MDGAVQSAERDGRGDDVEMDVYTRATDEESVGGPGLMIL